MSNKNSLVYHFSRDSSENIMAVGITRSKYNNLALHDIFSFLWDNCKDTLKIVQILVKNYHTHSIFRISHQGDQ